MTVDDLLMHSGMARADFYKIFRSKQACFLAAVDELYEAGMQTVRDGYSNARPWAQGIRKAFADLLELLVSQPNAAHMCLVDIYEVGAQGSERADRGAAGFERLLSRAFARSRPRAGLSPAILGGIVGGIHLLIHDRLSNGKEAELPETIDELVAWALSYRNPSTPLRRPQRQIRHEPERPSIVSPADRLLIAVAESVAEKGYGSLSVNDLAPRARTSLRTLYESFGGKEAAFLACFRMISERTLSAAKTAYDQEAEWPLAVSAANEAVLAYLASEPDFAKVATIEVFAAGSVAAQSRDEAIKAFAELVRPGYTLSSNVPPIAAEAMAFGVYSLIRRQILRYGPASLPRLGPTTTFFDLAPFLGAARATKVANAK